MAPPRVPSKFFDRIKNRVEDRIKRELSPQIPETPTEDDVPEEEVAKGLGDRIKQKVKEKVKKLAPVEEYLLDPKKPLDDPTIKYRIRYAGANKVLLYMLYGGQWRFVESYSYRLRGTSGKSKLLFYGWCLLHQKIHCFRLDKIQGLLVTNIPYSPRNGWDIEVARY